MTTLLDLTPALDLNLEFEIAFELDSRRIQWSSAPQNASRWRPLHSLSFTARVMRSAVRTNELLSFRIEGRPEAPWAQVIASTFGVLTEVSYGDAPTWAVSTGTPSRCTVIPAISLKTEIAPADSNTLHSPEAAAEIVWSWMTTSTLPAGLQLVPALLGPHRI